MIRTMARKNYSDEFRRQAVDLYESTPDATLKGIAADLGVSRGTLADWVRAFGTGSTAAPPEHSSSGAKSAGTESAAMRIARLEAENARLRADKVKVKTERDILRKAAKYFAGETNWCGSPRIVEDFLCGLGQRSRVAGLVVDGAHHVC